MSEPRDLSDLLGRIPRTTTTESDAARRTCAQHAADGDELRHFLDLLGLEDS